jgi:hypothetical protein
MGPDCSLFQHNNSKTHYFAPILRPQVCLDMSKVQLYQGLEMFENKFPGAKLVLSHTDLLLPHLPVSSESYFSKLHEMKDHFDLSTLEKDHQLFSTDNQGKMGVWKIVPMDITEYISIKTCVYSYLIHCKKCSGADKKELCEKCQSNSPTPGLSSTHKELADYQYFRQLLASSSRVNVFPSHSQQPKAESKKFSFFNLDVRRHLNKDGVTTTAFNHVRNSSSSNEYIS